MPARLSLPRRAPRPASRRRAAVLPGVLLAAVSTALAGLAVLPAAAEVPPRGSAPAVPSAAAPPPAAAPASPPAPQPEVNVALGSALASGLAVALAPPPPDRASRSRTAPEAAAAAPSRPTHARPGTGRLTSQFGRRWGRLHAGIDLAAGTGAPIFAAADGTVQSAGSEGGYGQAVRILHGDGAVTVYAHLSRLQVSAGERVSAGQQIGDEGSTGRSTGPHLHFEVRVGGAPVDPLAWLRGHGVEV